MNLNSPPLILGAYTITFEKCNFGFNYVIRRRDRPKRGRAYLTMALAIHHARRLNRKYPQRSKAHA